MYEKSIERLNLAVADELAAVHQYMYFHFHCEDQGLELLSKLFLNTSIGEMRHIDTLAQRILFLKGEVELVAADPVEKIHDVAAMLKKAYEMEQGAIRDYNLWANECSANADATTRKLFEALVEDEEGHFSVFDTELTNLEKYGQSYLALQAIERGKAQGGPTEG